MPSAKIGVQARLDEEQHINQLKLHRLKFRNGLDSAMTSTTLVQT